jgi:hypothetical protein
MRLLSTLEIGDLWGEAKAMDGALGLPTRQSEMMGNLATMNSYRSL